jgi:hypothetical protein
LRGANHAPRQKPTNYLNKVKTITHSEFAAFLAARRGAIILSILANTDPKARKTGNPFREIRKEQKLTVVTGADYTKAVEKQGGEGFKADGLSYGEFAGEQLKNKVIKTESGKLQLRTVFRNAPKPIKIEWIADGERVSKEVIAPYLPTPAPSRKQQMVGVTGKREVKVRNFDFNNIKQVTIRGGEPLELIPD